MDNTSREALAVKADRSREDRFIEANRKHILSCAYHVMHRFVTEQDDAYMTAMLAFHEAIDAYDAEKGEFLPFAAVIIRRRLYDELRKDKGELTVEPDVFAGTKAFDESTAIEKQTTAKLNALSAQEASEQDEKEAIREEIAEVQQLLAKYGFSFFDLVDCSPKSAKTREICKKAIVCVLRPGEIYEKMKRTKQLPIKELAEASGVPKKKLERHRKYIMAVAELLTGDFPRLNEYLRDIRTMLTEV